MNSFCRPTAIKMILGRRRTNMTHLRRFFCTSRNREALELYIQDFGDPMKVLMSRKVDLPAEIEENSILVRLKAATINPADINTIQGVYPIKPELPAVPGYEGVFEVIGVGANVSRSGNFQQGDWVRPKLPSVGTWRTHAVLSTDVVQKIPNDIDLMSSVNLINPQTAYRMLRDFTDLKTGDVVIQNSANSGVGIAAIQIAKDMGLKTINIVRDRPDIDELVKSLKNYGATHVLTEDFVRTPAMRELIASTGKPKLSLNGVGGKSVTEITRHLDDGAVTVTYGGMSKKPLTISTGQMIFKQLTFAPFWLTRWKRNNKTNPEFDSMNGEIFQLIREGKLKAPVIERNLLQNYETAITNSMTAMTSKKQVFVLDI